MYIYIYIYSIYRENKENTAPRGQGGLIQDQLWKCHEHLLYMYFFNSSRNTLKFPQRRTHNKQQESPINRVIQAL